MKVSDLKPEQIVVGLRVKAQNRNVWGTVTRIDKWDDDYAWIKWDDEDGVYSGFYGNNCSCEVEK